MKTLLAGVFTGVVLCGLSVAQDAAPPPTSGTAPPSKQSSPTQTPASSQAASGAVGGTPRIAPGSVIPVQLTKSIDAKKAKAGDEVEAKVTQDLKADNGEVIVRKDTKVVGHITEAQAHTKEQKESQVGIAFDHTVTKGAGDVPLPMSIQAIIAPSNLNGDNNNAPGDQPVSGPNAGRTSSSGAGRSTGVGAGAPSQTSGYPAAGGDSPGSGQGGPNAHQPITANTQGVVGIADLKLSTAANGAQGSVVSSEKNNVKLESGTLMLLRVSQ